jgi:polyhydroxyalkanoate synthesis regulator phasin
LIKLRNYSEQVKKDNLTFEDFCNINDHILSLNEIKEAAFSDKQKKYIKEIIEKLEQLLPKKFRKDNMYKREDDCDVLFRLR